MIFRVGILADIHTGSAFAPWPPDAELSIGGKHTPNIGQLYLNENWHRIAKEIPPLEVLILNGDSIGGQEPKDRGRYAVELDPQFQARAALSMLEPYLEKAPVRYMTEGTDYHEGESAMWAEWLAREIGAISKDEHWAWDWLLLEMAGLKFDVAHKQSIFMRYPTSALERELQFSDMIDENADVIIRSHNHRWGYVDIHGGNKFQVGVSTPSWQMQSHYVRVGPSPNRYGPLVLGMVILNIENGIVTPDKRFMFPHPQMRRSVYVSA